MEQNRKLGATEYLFKKTAGVAEITVKGTVDPALLNRAVNRVLIENPLVACRIVQKGKDFWFQHEAEYRDIVETRTLATEAEKEDYIRKSMARTSIGEDMVFLCTFLSCSYCENDTLLFSYNHAIADGSSLIHFIKAVFSCYAAVAAGDNSVGQPVFSPPMEEYPQKKKTFRDLRAILARELPIRLKKRARFPFHAMAPLAERQTRTIFRSVSYEMTVRYYKACRKSRTTVHGIFMAAMLFALARRLAHNEQPFSMANNVSMRALLNVPYEQMGAYVSVINNRVAISPDMEFWALAKSTRKALSVDNKNNLPAMSPVIYYPITRLMPKSMEMKMMNGPDMGRAGNLVVANLGKMSVPGDFGGTSVKNIISHVAIHHLGPDFGVVLMDHGGRFGFNLHYIWPLSTSQNAEAIMDDFLQLLERCTVEQEFFPLQ
jgi:NRPS condensation-like uncharacterized protein